MTPAPCAPNQVRNPATGRCVLRSGAVGQKVLADRAAANAAARANRRSPSPFANKPKKASVSPPRTSTPARLKGPVAWVGGHPDAIWTEERRRGWAPSAASAVLELATEFVKRVVEVGRGANGTLTRAGAERAISAVATGELRASILSRFDIYHIKAVKGIVHDGDGTLRLPVDVTPEVRNALLGAFFSVATELIETMPVRGVTAANVAAAVRRDDEYMALATLLVS